MAQGTACKARHIGGEERNPRRGRLATLGDDPGSSALGGVSDARDRGARKPSRPRAGRRSSMSSGGAARWAVGRSRGASRRYRGVWFGAGCVPGRSAAATNASVAWGLVRDVSSTPTLRRCSRPA